uniref:Uncharacterized protein n=1 Tax=Scleropages formosus TaxID=113540 RepID=A0A8C9TDZ3_SCLFO
RSVSACNCGTIYIFQKFNKEILPREGCRADDQGHKLGQVGCATVTYSPSTLIGNWFEERFDTHPSAQRRPLPSQASFRTFDLTLNSKLSQPGCMCNIAKCVCLVTVCSIRTIMKQHIL